MALAYYKILNSGDEFVRKLLETHQRLLPYIRKEREAAVKIQATWKRYKTRRIIAAWQGAALTIQTNWRIFLAKRKVSEMRLEQQMRNLAAFLDRTATIIQSAWRGYYARKTSLDYYKRKKKLQEIQRINDSMREQVQANYERQAYEHAIKVKEETDQKVQRKLVQTHCLLSTKQVPGVYANNKTMEHAIVEQTRKILRTEKRSCASKMAKQEETRREIQRRM
ncbi:spermatogenesis-associated protein 17-like [Paramacrobiotus metropolitanus]|uniref:spermatogenesis-associated protein 17-like n=1 Tax=Paramacrobiotus metropolitanus TaxID=2943436 RepID=UPI0024465869|nr:spermatogenesis-associated protein 17-like [Paramacrobiotus metropolitanus]